MRILLVEDNAVVRKGLTDLLNGELDMDVIGEASDGLEALTMLEAGFAADILLTDLSMPVMDGLELTRCVKAAKFNIPIIILTMHQGTTYFNTAVALGANGFLLKGEKFEDLLNGIRSVNDGGFCCSPRFRPNLSSF